MTRSMVQVRLIGTPQQVERVLAALGEGRVRLGAIGHRPSRKDPGSILLDATAVLDEPDDQGPAAAR